MWVIKVQKAESLVALGQLREAQEILDQCERDLPGLKPDEDLGLALHQLGNAFVRRGSLDYGDQAFRLAVGVRRALLKTSSDPELSNHLAGSHKMRAVVGLLKLKATCRQSAGSGSRRKQQDQGYGKAIEIKATRQSARSGSPAGDRRSHKTPPGAAGNSGT